MSKIFLTADDLLLQSFRLAEMIYDSGYRPDLICGVWRGGASVAVAVHEYFSWHGVVADHIPIRCKSYYGVEQQKKQIKVDSLEYLVAHVERDTNVLFVDDVFDTGRSINAIIDVLQTVSKISDDKIRVACPWYKPLKNKTGRTPDYFVCETDDWIVFPHELDGLNYQEILEGKSEIGKTLKLPENG
jgi:uncharacterized protein